MQEDGAKRDWRWWLRTGSYGFATLVVSWEMVAGSLWDLLQIDYVRAVFDHLGYPHYLLFIIGVWKLPCAVALMVPRFPRLKEWAYAGALFNYTGAAASHALAGDGPDKWVGPAVFAAFALASWALRPVDRRMLAATPAAKVRPLQWIVPIALLGAMVVLALATLPKGTNP